MRQVGLQLAAVLAVLPLLAGAETAVLAHDFTFHMMKASDAVAGRRITVQIDPVEQAALLAARSKVDLHPQPSDPAAQPAALAPVTPAGTSYDWFWNTVPVAQTAAAGRYALAMATLSNGPSGASVSAPRLQAMQTLAQTYGTEILKATVGTKVSPALVLAVMGIESGGNAAAVSPKGAAGLMQLIPDTAKRFGVTDASDPVQNIKGGVAYLDWLMGQFNRDPVMVLAAYNAGEGAVTANGGVPPFAETRDYVPKVLAAWQVAQGLCISPPELVTDPCVFRVISASN